MCCAPGRGDTFGGGYIDNYWYREDESKDEEVLLVPPRDAIIHARVIL